MLVQPILAQQHGLSKTMFTQNVFYIFPIAISQVTVKVVPAYKPIRYFLRYL